jgi:anti-sigma factor RsiW
VVPRAASQPRDVGSSGLALRRRTAPHALGAAFMPQGNRPMSVARRQPCEQRRELAPRVPLHPRPSRLERLRDCVAREKDYN